MVNVRVAFISLTVMFALFLSEARADHEAYSATTAAPLPNYGTSSPGYGGNQQSPTCPVGFGVGNYVNMQLQYS